MSFVKSEKSDKLIKLNTIIEQNQLILAQLAKQAQDIQILKEENKKIMENSDKVGKHIDFINRAYDKIANSYFGKHIFN